VTVADLKPFVTWDGPLQGVEGQPLTFDSTGTVAGGEADPITSLRWDFSDGSQPQVGEIATHTFAGDGTYVVRLTAFDEDLDDSENYLERQVEILDVSPTARFLINYPDPDLELGIEGQPVQLDASTSTAGAPSDPIAWYYWDFGDGSDVVRTANPVISHEWPDGPQDYIIELTVEDEDGSQNMTALNLSVANADPVVGISVNRASAEVGSTVTFTINVDDVEGDQPDTSDRPVVIEWDLGDGTLVNDQASVDHTFEREGTFAVHVRYVDGDGGEGEATFQFTSTPRLATLSDPVVSVIDLNGDPVADPAEPIREFSDRDVEEDVYYLKEGEELSISVQVDSARLSNGTLDTASMRWFPIPEGAVPVYTPITPPAGAPNEGEEVKRATVTW
jgi:PKD repeat protein